MNKALKHNNEHTKEETLENNNEYAKEETLKNNNEHTKEETLKNNNEFVKEETIKKTRRALSDLVYEKRVKAEINEWICYTTFVQFYEEIEKEVIGQESLKLIVGNVYNYLSNVINDIPINNNMILSAPSGCGKTETYRALRSYFAENIPTLDIYIFDVTTITASGFHGQDADSIIKPFFQKRIVHPIGIVFLDEIDKKLEPSYSSSGENVNRRAQSGLLTIIEGSEVHGRGGVVNTDRLMFVGLGSFESFRNERDNVRRTIGLNTEWDSPEEKHYKPLNRDDLVDAGASNEIIGRFPYIINYTPLSYEAVDRVIRKSIDRVSMGFNIEEILIDDPMIETLHKSANSKYGCRLIESTLREVMLKAYVSAQFDAPDFGVLSMNIVDADNVETKWRTIEIAPIISSEEKDPEESEQWDDNLLDDNASGDMV